MKMLVNLFVALICCVTTLPLVLTAQFGRNKVQYEDFQWKYIQTKNFDIYFHQDGYYLAEYAGTVMEEALAEFQTELNYTVANRIPLILYNSHNEFQQTNVIGSLLPEGVGGFTELAKNRIVLPFEGDWQQFKHVLRHELVHAFINDMYYGGNIQSYLSSNFNIDFPHWMSEGLAEYLGLGGYNTQTDMFMRDITISELLPPLNQLGGYYSYRAGQAFWWYVAQTYGRAKVGELINRLRSAGKVDQAFMSTFNMSLEDFSEKWMTEMKRVYLPDIKRYELPEEYATRLTDHMKGESFYNTSPAISPDGSKMAYISDKDMFLNVYVMDLETKKTRKVVSGMRSFDFEELNILTPGISWDPEGVRIAVSAKSGGEDALFIINTKSGKQEKFSLGLNTISSVQWSPDGSKIVFCASVGEKPNLYLFDIKSKKAELLTDDIFSDKHPAWSPDGRYVYFVSDRAEHIIEKFTGQNFLMAKHNVEQFDIYRISIATKVIERLTFTPQFEKTSVVPSPDGNSILYVSDENGVMNMYKMSLLTGTVEPVTNSLTGITHLSLSRDGSKMLFASQIKGGYDIFMLRFPFDAKPKKTPEPTEYRQRVVNEEKSIAEALQKGSVKDTLQGYGDFDLDFTRQQTVLPNPDIVSVIPGQPVQKVETAPKDSTLRPQARDYQVSFAPDIIMGNPGFSSVWGVLGQVQMLFSDILGDHRLFVAANLLLSLENSDLYLSYSYLPKKIDWEFAAFHSARFSNFGNENFNPQGFLYRFRYIGTSVGASLPFSTFSRLEFNTQFLGTFTENLDVINLNNRSRFHIVPQMRYVHDNAVWGNAFGPVHGNRMFISATASPKFGDVSSGFFTAQADYRQYFHLNDFLSLAFRGAMGGSFGPDPQGFFVAGQDNWINRVIDSRNFPYTSAEDLVFLQPVSPLRGWNINQSNGTKFFATNVEMRFPLFRALLAGPVPVLFQSISGVLFFDMGGTWNDTFKAVRTASDGSKRVGDLLMSTGIGMRTFLFGLPLKVDVAWRNEQYTWSRPEWIISLGYDF